MRLFVAIPLPEEVKEQLKQVQELVEGLRWQNPEQYHLTLRFIGSADQSDYEKVEDELSKKRVKSFEIDLNGFGYFPEKKNPRVLWVRVEKHPSLILLQNKVEEACRSAGLEAETRSYTPHITLAKVKGKEGKRDVMSFIEQYRTFGIESIPVEQFILYKSTLNKNRAVHTPLKKYSLH